VGGGNEMSLEKGRVDPYLKNHQLRGHKRWGGGIWAGGGIIRKRGKRKTFLSTKRSTSQGQREHEGKGVYLASSLWGMNSMGKVLSSSGSHRGIRGAGGGGVKKRKEEKGPPFLFVEGETLSKVPNCDVF